jgi:hypothetical protein
MMNRILKRPMFRMGGRSDDGIMSMRPGFKTGSSVPGSILGKSFTMPPGRPTATSPISTVQRFFPPVTTQAAGVPATIPTGGPLTTTGAGTGTAPMDRMFRAGRAVKKGFQGLMSLLTGPAAKTAGGTALSTAPLAATIGGLSYMNYPVYPKGHPQEGEFVSKEEAVDIFDKAGEAGTAADIAGEAAMFDLEPGEGQDEYGNFKYPTKFNFKDPEVVEISNKLNLFPDQPASDKPDKPITTTTKKDDGLGDEGTSDFEKSLNEYLPAIESALEIDDDATKRQLFLQLAKFGAGVLAQPGGDLVGTIGKAAIAPLEGTAKVLSDKQAAKRQAKLIAVQAAIKDMGPGSYGKNVNDIMKTFSLKGEEGRKQAGIIYNKILANDSTALSRDRDDLSDAAREDLRLKGGAIDAYVNNIRSIRESNPELIGKFNKVITSDEEPVDQEYYVTEEGEFVRYDKETDQFLQPGDKGFAGPKNKKK